MCAGMLALQAVVLFLTGVVLIGVTDLGVVRSLAIGLGLALACVVAAGLLRRRVGYLLGWAIQVVSILLGFVVGEMFFLGIVFAALWVGAFVLGTRIDEERAERAVATEQWSAEHETRAGPPD